MSICQYVTHVHEYVYMAPTYIYTCVTYVHMHLWYRYICYMCTNEYPLITWLLYKWSTYICICYTYIYILHMYLCAYVKKCIRLTLYSNMSYFVVSHMSSHVSWKSEVTLYVYSTMCVRVAHAARGKWPVKGTDKKYQTSYSHWY